ncbi:MAG: hypothetical protein ACM3KM_03965 [Acidobacteriaceae bacterium]
MALGSITNKKFILPLILLVILAVFLFVQQAFRKPTVSNNNQQAQETNVSHKIAGFIEKVENGAVFIKGDYVLDNGQIIAQGQMKEIKVSIRPETQFEKKNMIMPSSKELKAKDWKWSAKDVKEEIVSGTFDDIKSGDRQGLTVEVTANDNIFDAENISASKISYVLQVYPD